MRSRAAIGGHPIHPALVNLPIGSFFLLLIGDIAFNQTRAEFWYHFAFVALGIGILTALAAALFGFIDYFGVKMSAAGGKTATTHMRLNLAGVVLYTLNWFLRRDNGAFQTSRWPLVFGLEIVTFVALGISGWLGGKIGFEHKSACSRTMTPKRPRSDERNVPRFLVRLC